MPEILNRQNPNAGACRLSPAAVRQTAEHALVEECGTAPGHTWVAWQLGGFWMLLLSPALRLNRSAWNWLLGLTVGFATAVACLGLAVAVGGVLFEPKWPSGWSRLRYIVNGTASAESRTGPITWRFWKPGSR
jgi:hypothetical protein